MQKIFSTLALLGISGAAWAVVEAPVPVPEPATLGLIAVGAAAVGLLRRRR